jgi:hypothetical protein
VALTLLCLDSEAFPKRRVNRQSAHWTLAKRFREGPAVTDKYDFVDMISELTRQSRRRVMPRIVDLPTSPKETSRLSHWPPEHWAQWRLAKLTPWKIKPWEGKDWD